MGLSPIKLFMEIPMLGNAPLFAPNRRRGPQVARHARAYRAYKRSQQEEEEVVEEELEDQA